MQYSAMRWMVGMAAKLVTLLVRADRMDVFELKPTTLCKGLPTKTGLLPSPYAMPNGIPSAR